MRLFKLIMKWISMIDYGSGIPDPLLNSGKEESIMMTDEQILDCLNNFFAKFEQNRKLQDMALANGIDIKNAVRLTDEQKEALAVAQVALLLAKRENDNRYVILTKTGLEHRALKAEIINAYKDQAIQLINKGKLQMENNTPVVV